MRALLICNPTASAVTDARLRVVERALEATFDLEVVWTEDRGHAAEIARDAAGLGAKAVIVYGGDGTVNEVVNGLAGTAGSTDVTLGLLPGGGTNVFARTLGYPRDLVEATGHLLGLVERGESRRINLGHLSIDGPDGPSERLFTFGTGLALDADTVRRVDESGLRPKLGDAAFVYYCFRTFFGLRRRDAALQVQTPEGPVDAWWAIICQSDPLTYLGSRPVRVAPGAGHDRGLYVTAGASAHTVRTFRWAMQSLRSGRHVRDDQCLYLEDVDTCDIACRTPVPLQADGEYLGVVRSVRTRCLRGALPVYA